MTFKSRFYSRHRKSFGDPKYKDGERIGQFRIQMYLGHSDVNKRTFEVMSKPQHWYSCLCSCGTHENRSQQELNDKRRQQMCFKCRSNNS